MSSTYDDARWKQTANDSSFNEIKVLGRILPTTGKIHQQQEVYDINYIAPTCKATHYKNPIRVLVFEEK